MESIGFVNFLLLLGAALVVAGIFSSLIASRFGAPLLLVFLVIGMLAGEDGPGGLVFDDYQLTYLIGSLALSVILFDGGLRTRIARFHGVLAPSAVLATAGVVLTALVTGVFAMVVTDMSLLQGLLIGAVVSSTDAAAVFFLLHAGGQRLKQRVDSTLQIESATNDPIAVILTIVLVEMLLAVEGLSAIGVIGMLVRQAALGVGIGVAGGLAISLLLNRINLPNGLHPLFVVSSAVLIYALTALLGGSGFLAVYLGGLVLGNRPMRASASITSFHDAATWLCQIIMFMMLGLLVTPSELLNYAVPALIIAGWLMFVARPVAVWLCLRPFRFTPKETTFISWVGLRGAVSIFLAAIPMLTGLPNAPAYFNIAFFVVLISLIVQGWSIRPAARRLDMALPDSGPAVRRVELDLPGQLQHEIVGYPIAADTAVLDRGAVPKWARPVLVVRDGEILDPIVAGALRSGDYAYYLAPPQRVHRLDRLFARTSGDVDREALGEFPLRGDVTVKQLEELYGLKVPAGESDLTVADLFETPLQDAPEIGDRLPLGSAALVVRELDQGQVVRVGLQFEDLGGEKTEREPATRIERLLGLTQRPWKSVGRKSARDA
ncbi:MAG: potassium/proton antiporter [Gammaproteobacteria bacterium]